MHCFTESLAVAEAAMALGFHISFSGIVTFKNARELQEVARAVPLEQAAYRDGFAVSCPGTLPRQDERA